VTSKLVLVSVLAILICATVWGSYLRAQDDGPASSVAQQPIPPMRPQPPSPEDEARAKMEKDMAKKANEERHAALKRDTDKLLQLSTELKQYVDKSNQNMLSVDVIRKAEEIEKLAHSVKEKMKGN
jgi:hypothetical protein